MRKKSANTITEGAGNVFADLGLPGAGALRVKAEMTRQIYRRIKKHGLTQLEAAAQLGLKQPDVSKLMRGRYTGFSLDRLVSLLTALDADLDIVIRPRTGRKKRGARGLVRVIAG